MKKSIFITIEGIEGAGKSTAIRFMQEYLQEQACEVLLTREPGGTEVAEAIRGLLLSHRAEAITFETELLLFFASRAQHVTHLIKPALQAGKIVLCDRFTDSSYAYQCGGRGKKESDIKNLEEFVHGDLQPDLTFLLDIDPELGLQRAKQAGDLDRIESEKIHFFERVREFYLKRAKLFPERFRVIDASQSIELVKQSIKHELEAALR